ncbi:hypothetical protein FM106_14140 [Brachybacterium faecium]|nr:hypothetical protein FM106_14140 [Brachybacterium faecium]
MAGLDGLKKSLNSSHRLYNGSTLRGMLAHISLYLYCTKIISRVQAITTYIYLSISYHMLTTNYK